MQPKPSKLRPVPARKPASVPVDHRTKPLASDLKPKQQRVEQRKVSNELARSQMIPRKSLPPTKHRVISRPELKKKRKKMSEEDDLALKMVKEMCKTDRYAGRDFDDYDDRNMEASFEDIIKEEKRRYTIHVFLFSLTFITKPMHNMFFYTHFFVCLFGTVRD